MRFPFLRQSEPAVTSEAPRSGVRHSLRSGDQTLTDRLRHFAQGNVVRAIATFGGAGAAAAGASGCEPEVVYVDCDEGDECAEKEDHHHHNECEDNHHEGYKPCDEGEGEGEGNNGGNEGEGEGEGNNGGSEGEGEGRPVPNPTTCTYDPNLPDRDGDNVPDFLDTCPATPDETLTTTVYGECIGTNADGDEHSDACDPCISNPDPACGVSAGEQPSGQPDRDGDRIPDDQDACPADPTNTCNDQNGGQQQPSTTEICNDGLDNDYDGQIDEDDCVSRG
ncbi:MAG: hypothetical protein WCT53_04820 [Candidatus Gracilibacteria bacterium]